jgi:hypothetical protein
MPRVSTRTGTLLAIALAILLALPGVAGAVANQWSAEWPKTNFEKRVVPLDEIKSGGPSKDGIPPIHQPRFTKLSDYAQSAWLRQIAENEPVISLSLANDHRAYPLRVLIWHEIVNDIVAGRPVLITYCPLCNSAIVYDRSVDGQVLSFGTTGKLRHSDLIMYDLTSESWWQQFTGEAIIGDMAGRALKLVPSRLESFASFKKRFPDGSVLTPNDPGARRYGDNPYVGYDALDKIPFLYEGSWPDHANPMDRVVAFESAPGKHEAWLLSLVRKERKIRSGDILIEWSEGQLSAVDAAEIRNSKDVGNVVVRRMVGDRLEDVPYDITFAFAFHAFRKVPIRTAIEK